MIRHLTLVFAVLAGPAWADWVKLDAAGVQAALEEVTLRYEDGQTSQHFYASGRTLYDAGRPSWGYWAVRGDQYCSQWPPAGGWGCYELERHANDGRLRFIAPDGSYSIGEIAE